MIIQNFYQLAKDQDKNLALSIVESGLEAALPNAALEQIVHSSFLQIKRKRISLKRHRVYLISIGKSADLMAKVVNSRTKVHGGIVVLPNRMHSLINAKKFVLVESDHPIPSKKSVIAARKISDFVKSRKSQDFIIFLISGGASSLVSMPDGISLKDKQLVSRLLLKSGANIHEINCIRKHLSQIKGGRLVQSLRCKAVSLVMSDVIGDDLSVIASGITYCDRSTFSDAEKILTKYRLAKSIPKAALDRIILGKKRMIPESPKKPTIENYVISSNKVCVNAMKVHARRLGLATKTIWCLDGNVANAASKISRNFSYRNHSCLVFGGETTVKVKGKGRGGRNQELVLNILKKLQARKEKISVVSLGTDGIDGNTTAAGAIADSTMQTKPISRYLDRNNSYCYFKKYGGLIFTGPTHTNLMDIGLILQK